MRFVPTVCVLVSLACAPLTADVRVQDDDWEDEEEEDLYTQWPTFRGLHASGVAEGFNTPEEWDVDEGKGVFWMTDIAGLAHSSPVVWDDRVYVMTAAGEANGDLKVGLYGSIESVEDESEVSFQVLCLNKRTGEVIWEKTAHKGVPEVKRHPKSSHASSTPATDGKHVVAFFGSEGLYCYDTDGALKWQKDFGLLDSGFFMVPTAQWGFASSPVIHDGRVIVQVDVQTDSFLGAYDIETGEEVWRTAREETPGWSTPTLDVERGRIFVNGWKHMGGYELATGKEIWKTSGGGDLPVPTPVVAHDLVFIMNAHGGKAPILAVSVDAEGELTHEPEDSEHLVWAKKRRGNYMQTPLVYGDYLYCCSDSGILRCYEARTGEDVYSERLGAGTTGFSGSIVGAGGKLYATSEQGEVFVVRAGSEFELIATNDLGETCMSTPAVSEGTLYFRTRSRLVAIR